MYSSGESTAEPPETGVVLKSGPGAPIRMISVFCNAP